MGNRSRSGDPRRRALAVDPLSEFSPSEMCWCGSRKRYRDCHQIRITSRPGEPLLPDPEDGYRISRDVVLAHGALKSSQGPLPLTNHFPTPALIPAEHGLPDKARLIGQSIEHVNQTLSELGGLRYAILDSNGIVDASAVRRGEQDLQLDRCAPDLLAGALEISGYSIARLRGEQRSNANARIPLVLHHDSLDVRKLVGQTLFWADHYTTPDRLAELAMQETVSIDEIREPVAEILGARPLIEAGIVVPVATDIATASLAEEIDAGVTMDISDPDLVAWVEDQLLLEGPTAREAMFVHVRDDNAGQSMLYLYARNTASNVPQRQISSRMLGNWDPNHDYAP